MVTIPQGKEIFEGEIATYWFEDGVLVSLSKNNRRTVANITSNVSLVKKITDNKRVPLLIYLTNSPVPDKETREFSTTQLPIIYKAMAMVSKHYCPVKNKLTSKFMMNAAFEVCKKHISYEQAFM
jgi:hypothetical protein